MRAAGRAAAAAVALLAWGGAPASLAAQNAGVEHARSVLDGVYTAEQAGEGRAVFEEACSRCHSPADLSGRRFQAAWNNATVGDLFGLVSTTMPLDQPASLGPGQYAAVLAYVLGLNGYPPGREELASDGRELSRIRIERRPDAGAAGAGTPPVVRPANERRDR